MELGYFKETPELPGLVIDDIGKARLLDTVRWSKFIAIVMIVITGLMFIVGVFMGSVMSRISEAQGLPEGTPNMNGMIGPIYFAIGLIYIYPIYTLYMFSTKTKRAIINNNQAMLNEAFRFQRNMFKFIGIVTIACIVIYALVFIFIFAIGLGSGIGAAS